MTDSSRNNPHRDRQGTRISGDSDKTTGAGAEASEGIHAQPKARDGQRDPSDKSALTDRPTGDDGERRGSEPLADSEQHRGSYGGNAGAPRRPKDSGTDGATGSEAGSGGGSGGGAAR